MDLLQVDSGVVINLDAVASISAGDDSGTFILCIRYAVRGQEAEDGLAFQRFSGDEAMGLYKYLTDPSRCVDLREWVQRNSKPDVHA